jgi:hypothetical protein
MSFGATQQGVAAGLRRLENAVKRCDTRHESSDRRTMVGQWAPGKRVGNVLRASAVAVLTVAVSCPVGATVDVSANKRLNPPALDDLLYAADPIADSAATRATNVAQVPRAQRRHYRTAAGEDVRIWFPDSSVDEAQVAEWVTDFVGSLLHGDELEDVTFVMVAPPEIAGWCGPHAAACYAPIVPYMIIAPSEDPGGPMTAKAILAHEYGHHVANSRSNAPWSALFYGTKRWASYVDVCAATLAEQFFPGDGFEHYGLNPGEGFAEAYRVVNERRRGAVEAPWRLVDERFYPDAAASALIEQDVLNPWTAHNTATYRGRFTPGGPNRHSFEVATGLDGIATASVRAPNGAKFRVTQSMATVCGQRITYFTVRRVKGFGKFVLSVSRP